MKKNSSPSLLQLPTSKPEFLTFCPKGNSFLNQNWDRWVINLSAQQLPWGVGLRLGNCQTISGVWFFWFFVQVFLCVWYQTTEQCKNLTAWLWVLDQGILTEAPPSQQRSGTGSPVFWNFGPSGLRRISSGYIHTHHFCRRPVSSTTPYNPYR